MDLVSGLRLTLDLWHFHLDVDDQRSSVNRADYRMRHLLSGECIPHSFAIRDCQCPRERCMRERTQAIPPEYGGMGLVPTNEELCGDSAI
jgi:hypothetical protein